jgi:hypothetical protein
MKSKHLGLALAVAAIFSAPAFAQAPAGATNDINANNSTSNGTNVGIQSSAGAGSSSNAGVSSSANLSSGSSAGVSSGTGIGVTSGTGIAVQPSNASVTVIPSTAVAVPSANLMPGGVMAPAGSTTVLGGPSADVSGSQTVTTRYWVNVPAGADRNHSFQRWQHLR